MQLLERTLKAQREHWADVVSELLNGKKETHWCWFMFPNVEGLGHSENAKHFAVTPEYFIWMMNNSKEYAGNIYTVIYLIDQVYRNHPALDLQDILGEVDVLKFRSFITLVYLCWINGDIDIPSNTISNILKYSRDVYGSCPHTVNAMLELNTKMVYG